MTKLKLPMKPVLRIGSIFSLLLVLLVSLVNAAGATTLNPPENPATGIWIQQVGDIIPHSPSQGTLYYTKYESDGKGDRVKSISYHYNGAGYLSMRAADKKVVCSQADGVTGASDLVVHPDGDLLVAGLGTNLYKVNPHAEDDGKCLVHKSTPAASTSGFWQVMMDPSQKLVWGSGIPGYLFRFDVGNDIDHHISDKGYKVDIKPNASNRRKDATLTQIIWDGEGNAFFTYSDYMGGGCEVNVTTGASCSESSKNSRRAGAYFGVITDTTFVTVTEGDVSTYGGNVGESVIASFGTKILIDSLEGAHHGVYDPYSQTIILFGGARIVQVRTYRENGNLKAKVVAFVDLRELFFEETSENLTGPRTPGVGFRLNQGVVDGYGHLFVTSHSGHVIFIDFTGNPKKYIDDNVLIHMQWIDNYLEGLALAPAVVADESSSSSAESSSSEESSSSVAEESSSSELSSSSEEMTSSTSEASSSSSAESSSSLEESSSSGMVQPESSSSEIIKSSSSETPSSSAEPSSSSGESSSSEMEESSSSESSSSEKSSSLNESSSSEIEESSSSEMSSSSGEMTSSSQAKKVKCTIENEGEKIYIASIRQYMVCINGRWVNEMHPLSLGGVIDFAAPQIRGERLQIVVENAMGMRLSVFDAQGRVLANRLVSYPSEIVPVLSGGKYIVKLGSKTQVLFVK